VDWRSGQPRKGKYKVWVSEHPARAKKQGEKSGSHSSCKGGKKRMPQGLFKKEGPHKRVVIHTGKKMKARGKQEAA